MSANMWIHNFMANQEICNLLPSDIAGFSHNWLAYVLGCHGTKLTFIGGHYGTFDSFPSCKCRKGTKRTFDKLVEDYGKALNC